MIKFEKLEVIGWEHAIRGMRNPLNSWEKSDSFVCKDDCYGGLCEFGGHNGKECPVTDDNNYVLHDMKGMLSPVASGAAVIAVEEMGVTRHLL